MHRSLREKLWAIAVWSVVVFFVVNLLAMIGSVVVNSFGTRWFNTWLPAGFTPQWYTMAWAEFHLPDILVHMRTGGISTGGWRSTLQLNREVIRACRDNGLPTNWPKLLSKYPAKVLEFVLP